MTTSATTSEERLGRSPGWNDGAVIRWPTCETATFAGGGRSVSQTVLLRRTGRTYRLGDHCGVDGSELVRRQLTLSYP